MSYSTFNRESLKIVTNKLPMRLDKLSNFVYTLV